MPKFHPDIHFLTEFSAGTLCDAHKLCVMAHLEHCQECRDIVAHLDQLGGRLLENAFAAQSQSSPELQLEPNALDKVFAAIDLAEAAGTEVQPSHHKKPLNIVSGIAEATLKSLGSCVQKLLSQDTDFKWEKISRALSIGRIKFADRAREVALHRLEAGGSVDNHDHRGREITVVLTGSFSDQDGLYLPGDFLLREPGDTHRPVASNDGSCVCLSVLEAPVKFRGISRLINPFLKLKPRAA